MFDLDLSKSYGILLSGGLDSATLLSLIVKSSPNVNIQPFTIPKHDGSSLYANNIISHINDKFGAKIPNTIYVGNPNVYHRHQSTTAIIEIFDNYSIDILFNGVNQNPPELETLPGAPNRVKQSSNLKIVLPFVNYYKDQILELVYKNNLEYLIDITHSCTEMQLTRCNICWQCTERAWAFKKLNKIDTGKF